MKSLARVLLGWLVVLATSQVAADTSNNDLLRKQADSGDADAQVLLGIIYEGGIGRPRDDSQAFALFNSAANQGNAVAQFRIGKCYEEGRGVPKDNAQAITWYRKAAEQGSVQARSRLRTLFIRGQLVPAIDDQAGDWWRKLTEQADAEAQYFSRMRAAADRGDANDQVKLGLAYLTGIGTKRDRGQATAMFRTAADKGQVEAQCLLAAINACDSDWKVRDSNIRAVDTCRKAAVDGYVDAQLVLGILIDTGRGNPKDNVEAAFWVRKAADQGQSEAQWNLGYMYERGEGVPKDGAQAKNWYRKAAANGHQTAQFSLALEDKNTAGLNLALEHFSDNERGLLKNLWASPVALAREKQAGKEIGSTLQPEFDKLKLEGH